MNARSKTTAVLLALACALAPAWALADAPRFHVGYRVVELPAASGEDSPLTVNVWYPTDAPTKPYAYCGPAKGDVAVDAAPRREGGPFPLLVWSHGLSGAGVSSVFLLQALAAQGWIVVAPDLHDPWPLVRTKGCGQTIADQKAANAVVHAVLHATAADRAQWTYRLAELHQVLSKVTSLPGVGPLVDEKRIAVGGHSFGGFAALGVAGAAKEVADPRVRAVLLFSSGTAATLYTKEELARVSVPVALFLGQKERPQMRAGIPMWKLADTLFSLLHVTRYLFEVKGALHMAFTDKLSTAQDSPLRRGGNAAEHAVMLRYAVAFLDRWVLGDESAAKVLAHGDPMLTQARREAATSSGE